MNLRLIRHGIVLAAVWLTCHHAAGATTYYVATAGSEGALGTSWDTALLTISNAVAKCGSGDTVLVSNGTYNVTSQITVASAITVRGVNGASNTVVRGGYPASTNRIFYLTDSNAVVDGLTITNGYVINEFGGGVFMTCGSLLNCTVAGCTSTNSGPQARGGGVWMSGGTISNCTFTTNRTIGVYTEYSHQGGGGAVFIATNGVVRDSLFTGNNGHAGGAVYMTGGIVSNCTIRANRAYTVNPVGSDYEPPGGGVYKSGGTVASCLIVSNAASGGNANGGGLCGPGLIQDCVIMGNSAVSGGGVYFPNGGTLQNCLLIRNSAQSIGGGMCGQWGSTLQNCTVVNNSAGSSGGGIGDGQAGWLLYLRNSVVYFNTAPNGANWQPQSPLASYYTNISSCTIPALPGPGGITNDPQFVNVAADDCRLLSVSPCVNTGTNQAWMTNALDLAGSPRIIEGIVDMGAYEFRSNTLQCSFAADSPVGFVPHPVVFTASVSGTNLTGLYYQWDFTGDGTIDAQGPGLQVVTNTYTCGWFTVALTVTNSIGEIATATNVNLVRVGAGTNYVSPSGLNVFPYTNWTTASTGIQAAVDAGVDGSLVLVTNGTYSIAGQISITNGVTVMSVNGASNTVVRRSGAAKYRIFYLSHPGAVLDGLTITNGYETFAGGVYIQKRVDFTADIGGTVRNCSINGNSVDNYGGGVYIWYGGTLRNCTINGNTVLGQWYGGGGVYGGGTLENCVIQGNKTAAAQTCGGGVYLAGGTMRNCLVTGNSNKENPNWPPTAGGGGVYNGGLVDSCTVAGNWGWNYGGVYGGTISNSIVYYNTASNTASGGTNISGGAVAYSCSPDVVNGVNGNITALPQFVNPGVGYGMFNANGNFRLQSVSPCLNAGTNLPWMFTGTDLLGRKRIAAAVVDMGAYELPPGGTVFVAH